MRIQAFYKNVDVIIASIKLITIKNRTIMFLFSGIDDPPAVIVTKCSIWLGATIYYVDNLADIKQIINMLHGKGS